VIPRRALDVQPTEFVQLALPVASLAELGSTSP
jgi:hypothetical protein